MHRHFFRTAPALAACVALYICPRIARAEPSTEWTVTTADFSSRAAKIQSIDSTGVTIGQGGDAQTIRLSDLLDLTRVNVPTGKSTRLALDLLGADRIAGEPAGLANEQLTWKSAALGEVGIPLRNVVGVAGSGESPGMAHPTSNTEDVVQLSNGDTVRGVVSQLNSTGVTVTVNGDSVPVPLASIARIDLAQTGAAARAPETSPRYRVRLVDGSRVTVPVLSADREVVKFDWAGAARTVRWNDVAAIEQLDGPVSWLSAREPAEQVQTPHLPGREWPAKMDRAVDGSPLRFGPRSFAHGIGVHAYSRLTYPLDGTYKIFRTRYALAGDLPYADVTVRVLVDGKIVHENRNFRAGVLAELVQLDVSAGKLLTLEVDYGSGNDVQDRLNWIEPALVRSGK